MSHPSIQLLYNKCKHTAVLQHQWFTKEKTGGAQTTRTPTPSSKIENKIQSVISCPCRFNAIKLSKTWVSVSDVTVPVCIHYLQ